MPTIDKNQSPLNRQPFVILDNDYSNQDIVHKTDKLTRLFIESGAPAICYRADSLNYLKMHREAKILQSLCIGAQVKFIVYEHLDLAMELKADGIHLTKDSLPATIIRNMLGPNNLIGMSVRSLVDAQQIDLDEIDYVLIEQKDRVVALEEVIEILIEIKNKSLSTIVVLDGEIANLDFDTALRLEIDAIKLAKEALLEKKPIVEFKKIKKALKAKK